MAFPTIQFDPSGSDTAASGDNTVAAITGTAGAVTNSSTSATIGDAVNLSGVPTTGAAVLWIVTGSGRQYSRILGISGSSGAWTLTLEDSVWTTGTGLTWAIGGLRKTTDATNSKRLFTTDAKSGWALQTNGNQTQAANYSLVQAGDTTNGPLTIQGNSDVTRPIFNCTANAANFSESLGSGRYVFKNLQLTNSNASKTSAIGFSNTHSMNVTFQDCILGDATNQLLNGIKIAGGNTVVSVLDTEIKNCTDRGIYISGNTGQTLFVDDCKIHDNGAPGVSCVVAASSITVQNSAVYNNATDNISIITTAITGSLNITNNVIDGATSGGNGIDLGSAAHVQVVIYGNNITGNLGYGVLWTLAAADAVKVLIDYNCFGNGSATDGPANTSGAYNGLTAGTHDQIGVSPNYVGRGGSPPNFTNASTSNVKAKGYPDSTRTIGGNTGGSTSYVDIGIQHQDSGGGGGMLVHPGMAGGMRA
jgi:hypothetical protein